MLYGNSKIKLCIDCNTTYPDWVINFYKKCPNCGGELKFVKKYMTKEFD